MVFDGDKNGQTLEAGGVRKLTLRPMNMKFGGVIRFAIKVGDENGIYCAKKCEALASRRGSEEKRRSP